MTPVVFMNLQMAKEWLLRLEIALGTGTATGAADAVVAQATAAKNFLKSDHLGHLIDLIDLIDMIRTKAEVLRN